jgi:transporter family-2 protein
MRADVPARSRGLLPLAAALVAGSLLVIQSRINGELATQLHSGLEAALVSFGSGLVILTILLVLVRPLRTGLRSVAAAVRSGELRRWQVFGGFIGGFFVAVQATTVPLIGVAVFTVSIVAGSSSASLVVDWIGLGPAGRQPISARRVVAAVIAVVAVYISVSDRLGGASLSIPAILLVLAAGCLSAVQQAINGRVGVAARQPVSAAWINFFGGSVALAVVLIAAGAAGATQVSAPSGGWWLYLGGSCGVVVVALGAWLVPKIGVLLAALLTILGQLACALLLDLVVPTAGTSVGWHLVAGVALTLAAALLAIGRRR